MLRADIVIITHYDRDNDLVDLFCPKLQTPFPRCQYMMDRDPDGRGEHKIPRKNMSGLLLWDDSDRTIKYFLGGLALYSPTLKSHKSPKADDLVEGDRLFSTEGAEFGIYGNSNIRLKAKPGAGIEINGATGMIDERGTRKLTKLATSSQETEYDEKTGFGTFKHAFQDNASAPINTWEIEAGALLVEDGKPASIVLRMFGPPPPPFSFGTLAPPGKLIGKIVFYKDGSFSRIVGLDPLPSFSEAVDFKTGLHTTTITPPGSPLPEIKITNDPKTGYKIEVGVVASFEIDHKGGIKASGTKSIDMECAPGKVSMTPSEISMEVGASKFKMDATGKIDLEGTQVSASAKASMALASKGTMSLDSTADMTIKSLATITMNDKGIPVTVNGIVFEFHVHPTGVGPTFLPIV